MSGEGHGDRLGEVRQIILPVDDVPSASRWVQSVLGLPLRFADGDRFAVFDAGAVSIALAAPQEQAAPGEVAIGVRVDAVEAARDRVAAAGSAYGEITTGAHEQRLTFTAPGGARFVAYSPLPPR